MDSSNDNSQQSVNRDQLVVEMRGIVKKFPGVLANDHVDFELRRGEIHALLGENGAGKSTLMNVLAGLYHPEAGEIFVNEVKASFSSPRAAIDAGLGLEPVAGARVAVVREDLVVERLPGPCRDVVGDDGAECLPRRSDVGRDGDGDGPVRARPEGDGVDTRHRRLVRERRRDRR